MISRKGNTMKAEAPKIPAIDELKAAVMKLPHTINQSLRPWVETHLDNPELATLVMAAADAETRLVATKQRFDDLHDLMDRNDNELVTATESTRSTLLAERAAVLAERDAMPEQIKRCADVKARSILRLLRLIEETALIEIEHLNGELEPLNAQLNKLWSQKTRDQNAPRPFRMTKEEMAEHNGKMNQLGAARQPVEERRKAAVSAYQGARLTATRMFGSNGGIRVDLRTRNEAAWDRAITHFVSRHAA